MVKFFLVKFCFNLCFSCREREREREEKRQKNISCLYILCIFVISLVVVLTFLYIMKLRNVNSYLKELNNDDDNYLIQSIYTL